MTSESSRFLMAFAFLTLLVLVACEPRDRERLTLGVIDTLAPPAAAGSGDPNLSATPDCRVYLSWLEPVDDSAHALRFSTFEGDGWTAPRTIAQRGDFFVNWADFPSIVALSDR